MNKNYYFVFNGIRYRINVTKYERDSNYNCFAHLFTGKELIAGFSIKKTDINKDYLTQQFIDLLNNPQPLFT
jgi:hypothetical protein